MGLGESVGAERDILETMDVLDDAIELTQAVDPGMVIAEIMVEELAIKPVLDFLEEC